jgi:hypothetical protein
MKEQPDISPNTSTVEFSFVSHALDELVLKRQLADATEELARLRKLKDAVRATVCAPGNPSFRLGALLGAFDVLFPGELDK